MEIWTVIYSLTAVIVVEAQQPIVDKSVIVERGTFTVTCDVSRFVPGDIPLHAPYISHLSLERTVGTSSRSVIAQYLPLAPTGFNNLTTYIPPARNWLIEASGGVSSGTVQTNNKNTIKITLLVRDASCEDAGTYSCNASYLSTLNGAGTVSNFQNVAAVARTEDPLLTLDHHNGIEPDVSTNTEGEIVSLNCKVRGPYGLVLSWLTGPASGYNFVPHPIANDIQTVTPSPPTVTASPCTQYLYESIFNITVQPDVTMYICLVNDGSIEVTRKNFTIDGNPTQQPMVDKTAIVVGGTFTATCDISRVVPGDCRTSSQYISQLTLERTVGTLSRSVIAQYVPLAPFGSNNPTTNIPPGRVWDIKATGGLSSGTIQTNNKNCAQITLVVKDALYEDAGIYRCNASYRRNLKGTKRVSRFQYISVNEHCVDGLIILSK